MDWRVTFANTFGPGMFGGTRFRDWWRLLRNHRFQVDPVKLPRVLSAFACTLQTSCTYRLEEARFRRKWEQMAIQPPLIILGHWRSGTTHLHNLLSQDDRFAFPNLYQVLNPLTFLSVERIDSRLASVFLPKTRFGLDNVRLKWTVPYEDEFAIGITSFRSPFLSYAWPKSHEVYDRYLTLRDVSEQEIHEWRDSLLTFVKKLTWKYANLRRFNIRVSKEQLPHAAGVAPTASCVRVATQLRPVELFMFLSVAKQRHVDTVRVRKASR